MGGYVDMYVGTQLETCASDMRKQERCGNILNFLVTTSSTALRVDKPIVLGDLAQYEYYHFLVLQQKISKLFEHCLYAHVLILREKERERVRDTSRLHFTRNSELIDHDSRCNHL